MKRFSFLFCLFAAACSPRVPDGEFHIEGRIAGLRDSVVVEISRWNGNTGQRIATDTITGGRFSFVLPMAEKAWLSISPRGDEFPSALRYIFAEPGEKITVRGEGPLYLNWTVRSRVAEQREADAYISQSKEDYIRMQQLSVESRNAMMARNRPAYDSLRALEDENYMAIMRGNVVVMKRTSASEVWLDKLNGISRMIRHDENAAALLRDDAMALYEKLTPEQKKLPVAQGIRINLFPPKVVGVGDGMADAELKAFDGSTHKLSDYAGRGKYLILDFWSSGCGPCIMSMPELKALGEKYPETLKVIGINTDTSEEGWRRGTEMFKPSYLNLNAPPSSDVDESYGVSGIPHFVIVSPEGVIVESWVGYGEGLIGRKLAAHIDKSPNNK